ncbi:MAG: hypothetical protein OXR67_16380 [Chloroflexota bacterium]|nr:hypothetical protein [Chloroflexota bacterium]
MTARVDWEDGVYLASIESLGLSAEGETLEAAQDELINVMRNWIEIQDARSLLEETMALAGIPGVEEGTELQLEFLELSQES